jgi:hypothetical protein
VDRASERGVAPMRDRTRDRHHIIRAQPHCPR